MKKLFSTLSFTLVVFLSVFLFTGCGSLINYHVNNESYGTVRVEEVVEGETTFTKLTASPAEGCRFVRWTLDGDEYSTDKVIMVEKSIENQGTYVANFESDVVRISKVIITTESASSDVELNSLEITPEGFSVYNNLTNPIVSFTEVGESVEFFHEDISNTSNNKIKVFGEGEVKLHIFASLHMASTPNIYGNFNNDHTYTLQENSTGRYIETTLFYEASKNSTSYKDITIRIFFENI